MMSVGRGRDDGPGGRASLPSSCGRFPIGSYWLAMGGCSQMRMFGVHVLSVRFGPARNRDEFNQGSTVV